MCQRPALEPATVWAETDGRGTDFLAPLVRWRCARSGAGLLLFLDRFFLLCLVFLCVPCPGSPGVAGQLNGQLLRFVATRNQK